MSRLKFFIVLLIAAAHAVAAFGFLYHGDAKGAFAQALGSLFWVSYGFWEEARS